MFNYWVASATGEIRLWSLAEKSLLGVGRLPGS